MVHIYMQTWYYSLWLDVLTTTAVPPQGTSFDSHSHHSPKTPCDHWGRAVCAVIAKIGATVSSLTNLSTIFNDPPGSSDCCFIARDLRRWRRQSEEEIAKIPKLHTFLEEGLCTIESHAARGHLDLG